MFRLIGAISSHPAGHQNFWGPPSACEKDLQIATANCSNKVGRNHGIIHYKMKLVIILPLVWLLDEQVSSKILSSSQSKERELIYRPALPKKDRILLSSYLIIIAKYHVKPSVYITW